MSSRLDLDRLRQTLGSPELKWVLDRARRRLERGDKLDGEVILRSPSAEQRSIADRLMGRAPSRGADLTVDLTALAHVLRHAEICDTLESAVEALTGPLVNRKEVRESLEASWMALFRDTRATISARHALAVWLEDLQSSGLLRRLSGNDLTVAAGLLGHAALVLEHLPAADMPLAELAAAATGDSHALDADSPLSRLVLRAIAALTETEPSAVTSSAEARRDAWDRIGVFCDELSAPVLILNLRTAAADASLTARALGLHGSEGEPYRISVRQLLRHPPRFDAGLMPIVHVCENPTVVAAAANRLGNRSAPILAIEGQPKTAARLLLKNLTASGVQLFYHGDFDWAGIQIANLVMARHAAMPWRFSASDYLNTKGGTVLEGVPVAATWDPGLAVAMTREGRAIHEEQVLKQLLADLVSARA